VNFQRIYDTSSGTPAKNALVMMWYSARVRLSHIAFPSFILSVEKNQIKANVYKYAKTFDKTYQKGGL